MTHSTRLRGGIAAAGAVLALTAFSGNAGAVDFAMGSNNDIVLHLHDRAAASAAAHTARKCRPA